MLNFNFNGSDYLTIYEALKNYYPIGIKKLDPRMFNDYPGRKELEKVIVDNIHNPTHFKERWEDFTKEIATGIGKEIIGTTYGQQPCFSAYVLLETSTLDNLTRTKEIHFFVSLIGPFYTIIGKDNSTVKVGHSHFYATNYLVVSPENEYATVFSQLCERIEKRFKGYRFVSFTACQSRIEHLNVYNAEEDRNTVFDGLFNDQVDLTVPGIIGNEAFKHQEWLKEGYEGNGGWTMYPPGGREP
jgi:hypothetical protein